MQSSSSSAATSDSSTASAPADQTSIGASSDGLAVDNSLGQGGVPSSASTVSQGHTAPPSSEPPTGSSQPVGPTDSSQDAVAPMVSATSTAPTASRPAAAAASGSVDLHMDVAGDDTDDEDEDPDYTSDDAAADESAESGDQDDDVVRPDDEDEFGFMTYEQLEKMDKVPVIPLDIANNLNIEQHFRKQSPELQRKIRLILHLMRKSPAHVQAMQLKHFFKDLAGSQTEAEEVHQFDCKTHPIVFLFKGGFFFSRIFLLIYPDFFFVFE